MRISDWSSDVCSSDLLELDEAARAHVADAAETELFQRMVDRLALRVEHPRLERHIDLDFHGADLCERGAGKMGAHMSANHPRSEERRSGKDGGSTCRYRWSTVH